tara:strand:- start:398 stop:847 length:450 start_codon:yes stop_codon:yes gene_type:complete
MPTVKRQIKKIVKYDRNPRHNTNAIEPLLESLRKHGQVKPIILSAKNYPFKDEVVCCGHSTLLALEKFGATEVDCVIHRFSSEKEFADYNIRDNKTSEYAEWDESEYNALVSDFELDFDVEVSDLGIDDEPEDQPEDKGKCGECGRKIK